MKFACQLNDILPGTGVCALLEGRQIALFRPSAAEVFAIDNRDPSSPPTCCRAAS